MTSPAKTCGNNTGVATPGPSGGARGGAARGAAGVPGGRDGVAGGGVDIVDDAAFVARVSTDAERRVICVVGALMRADWAAPCCCARLAFRRISSRSWVSSSPASPRAAAMNAFNIWSRDALSARNVDSKARKARASAESMSSGGTGAVMAARMRFFMPSAAIAKATMRNVQKPRNNKRDAATPDGGAELGAVAMLVAGRRCKGSIEPNSGANGLGVSQFRGQG